MVMAVVVKAEGTIVAIMPEEGAVELTISQKHKVLGHTHIERVIVDRKLVLLVDEDAGPKALARNEVASLLARCPIFGDAILVNKSEAGKVDYE